MTSVLLLALLWDCHYGMKMGRRRRQRRRQRRKRGYHKDDVCVLMMMMLMPSTVGLLFSCVAFRINPKRLRP